MVVKHVDVRFTFEVDQDILEEEGEVCLDLASIQRLDGNLSKEEGRDIVEILAQSDRYWTDHAWKILNCIEGVE